MLKKLFFAMVTSFFLVTPVSVQASEFNFETALQAAQDNFSTITMYAHNSFDIYAEPATSSEIKGTSEINTSFDTVLSYNGWTMILAEDGVAFIESNNLFDFPLKTYSEHELYLLAHLIAGEAQPCSDDEQRYVASVALNRVVSERFPNDLESVIFQKGQYACVPNKLFYREPTESNWANAQYILENGSVLPPEVVWQSGGKQGRGVYLKTKWHYYCY